MTAQYAVYDGSSMRRQGNLNLLFLNPPASIFFPNGILFSFVINDFCEFQIVQSLSVEIL